jgi:alpha-glucosidase
VPQLLNLGLSGFALSGGDVGGFLGSPTADLLTRWVQLGAFTPFFRNHTALGTADQEAWVHGPDHEAIRRRAIEARYRLLPYLYTLADETSRTGTPMMRPMVLEFPAAGLETEETQFMLGNALLVAPWPDETLGPYPLRLPMGTAWYDYWTGRRLDASDDIKLEKRLDHLAVLARAGSIVPHQPLMQSTAQVPDGPLLLHAYPGPECSGAIYQDDGVSFAYRQQGFLRQQFACTTEAAGYRLHLGPREGAWEPWWHGIEVLLHGADKPARRIDAARGRVDEASYDEAQGVIRFRIDADAAGNDVHIETG